MKALAASNIDQYEKAVRVLVDYHRSVELRPEHLLQQTCANDGT